MSEEPDAEPGLEPGDADDPDAELPGNEPEPRDEPRVPLSRLTRLGTKLGGEITALKEELASLKAQNAPKKVTKAELEAEVEAGRLSREQADAKWENQLKADVAAEVKAEVRQEAHQQTLSQQLSAYEEAVPELKNDGSETYAKVADEYQALLATGLPVGPASMLAACRAVLGPIGALKQVRKAPEPKRESHQEGGSGGGGDEPGKNSKRPAMTAKQKEYYRGQIAKGLIPDWDAAYKEVEDGAKARARAGL